jgi:hypothetical protein
MIDERARSHAGITRLVRADASRCMRSYDADDSMFGRLRRYLRRRRYAPGARLSQFLAPDIRREVEVVDASELDDGFVTVRVRTFNVLYVLKHLAQAPSFSEPMRLEIRSLWQWTGELWGGPVPEDDVMNRPS